MEIYQHKYQQLLPKLSERARRLVVAADAKSRGRGGSLFVHKASGISLPTIRKGIRELDSGVMLPENRDRHPGGGRKNILETDATVANDWLALVEASSQGDPESLLKWTNKSLRTWEKELKKQNHTHQPYESHAPPQGQRLPSAEQQENPGRNRSP
jgi:hypothetical protein